METEGRTMSEGSVHERVARVMAALNYIPKQRAQGVSYEFRGIDAVFNHLHSLLADEGLFLSPQVLDDWQVVAIPGTKDRTQYQAVFRVRVDVEATDGSRTTLGTGLCQSHDYGDKAVYQAQQNGVKYVLLEAFAIPTAEQDMDARQPDPGRALTEAEISERLSNRLKARAVELCGGDKDAARELFERVVGAAVVTHENAAGFEMQMQAAADA